MERIISKHKGDKSWKTDLSIKDHERRRKNCIKHVQAKLREE